MFESSKNFLSNYLLKILDRGTKKYFEILQDEASEKTTLNLENIRLQTNTYNINIPIVFGEIVIAGNIIWNSDIRKVVYEHSAWADVIDIVDIHSIFDILKPSSKDIIEFRIDIAIAICEGVVDDLLGVFIEEELIDTKNYNFRFYKGTQTQEADPIIKKNEGEDAPAFRGICYCVFENFNLTAFNNKIPKFEFFIKRNNFGTLNSRTSQIKSKIKGVNLMPGSGEFVYETSINKSYKNVFWNSEEKILDGEITYSNNNTNHKISDVIVSLNQLQDDLPELEWVSVVVTWFIDDINIKNANIFPAVSFNNKESASAPLAWHVGSKNRWQVREISTRKDGTMNYGGTVNDQSVINLLIELKNRGYKIIFYPMLFVDNEEKPWRGRITGEAQYITNFFHKEEGYNNFILHYANLVHNFVDAFIIGSEMKGLTQIQNQDNSFPAVSEFINLAKLVKHIAPNMLLTYAADWSEYHSINGFYNMDDLWSNDNIDFIGIDAYFPLTYTKQKPSIAQIKEGWTSGEGYDFYFYNGNKITYESPNFAWKNMRWFIENKHINKDGSSTSFIPKSKKIWFTEFGFPSVDLCTNQPNVFLDQTSKESKLPMFSQGSVDFGSQKNALYASLNFIEENSDIIENAFVWCYDARPFPFFPHKKDIWQDGNLWQKGHWINGKLGSNTFDEIVKELCIKSGIKEEELSFVNCDDLVEGMFIDTALPFNQYIEYLCDIYFVKISSCASGLKFRSIINLDEDFTIKNSIIKKYRNNSDDFEEESSCSILPSAISLSFIDKTTKYHPSNITFNLGDESGYFNNNIKMTVPVVFSKERALQVAQNLLSIKRSENFVNQIYLPFSNINFFAGDVIKFENSRIFINDIKIDNNYNIILVGHQVSQLSLFFTTQEEQSNILINNNQQKEIKALAIALPSLEHVNKNISKIGVFITNLTQKSKIFFNNTIIGEVLNECIRGVAISGFLDNNKHYFFEDKSSILEVFLYNAQNIKLQKNKIYFAFCGEEFFYFKKFLYQGKGIFKLSQFYRKRLNFKLNIPKEEFLILNEKVFYTILPNIHSEYNFSFQHNSKTIDVPFKLENNFEEKISIVKQHFVMQNNGILIYWIFVSNYNYDEFENNTFINIKVEIKINNKIIITQGESYFIDESKSKIDFYVKII